MHRNKNIGYLPRFARNRAAPNPHEATASSQPGRPPHALKQRCAQQERPMSIWIGSRPAEQVKLAHPCALVLFLEPPLVSNSLLLNVFDIDRATALLVTVECRCRSCVPYDRREQTSELDCIMEPTVETQAAKWIVDVSSVAGEEGAAFAEAGGNPLVNPIEIAMHDPVGAALGEEFL